MQLARLIYFLDTNLEPLELCLAGGYRGCTQSPVCTQGVFRAVSQLCSKPGLD